MKNGLLIGRWQTLHEGHDWLIEQVIQRGLRPIIAIRNTSIDENNPLGIGSRMANIVSRYGDKVDVIAIPDIAGVFYGRDVGYDVVELVPPDSIGKISGRAIREKNKGKKTAG